MYICVSRVGWIRILYVELTRKVYTLSSPHPLLTQKSILTFTSFLKKILFTPTVQCFNEQVGCKFKCNDLETVIL